jgi:hypothetical protein
MPTRLLLGTLAVLIVAGAIGTVYFQRQSAQHAARAATLERDLAQARAETTQERERAQKLSVKATELDIQLGNAKTRTTATDTKNSQLSRELNAVKSSLTERQLREVTLIAEIESLRQKIQATVTDAPAAKALTPSAATVTSAPPTETTTAASTSSVDVAAYRERISALEEQLTELLARALAEPATPLTPPAAEPTPTAQSTPVHQVVRVGPHDAFVIVDFGRDEGAQIGDELTLYRGTAVVARVQISDARAKFSVAQVLPAALKRQLQPGDFVLIAK